MNYMFPTRKDKDEEGTDSSYDTDDLTHVGDEHGDEQGDGDPYYSQNHSAAVLKRVCHHAPFTPPHTQHQVQDHWPVPCDAETDESQGCPHFLKWGAKGWNAIWVII